MTNELEPCPFCGKAPSIGLCGTRVIHTCEALGETIFANLTGWNTRYKRTCKNLYHQGSSLGEGGFRCSECDGEMYGDEPNFCCYCGAEVVDGD